MSSLLIRFPVSSGVLYFRCIEGVLHHRDERLLGERLVLVLDGVLALAERERDAEPAARDLVERLADDADVLRLLRLTPVEVGARRELEREHLPLECRGPRLA